MKLTVTQKYDIEEALHALKIGRYTEAREWLEKILRENT